MANPLPSLSPKLWKWLYNKIAALDTLGNFLFMNYGYSDQNTNTSIKLNPEDEPFRYAIQLYHHVTQDLLFNNKDVLEIGSGLGGGGAFILQYKNPRTFVGVDLSNKAIVWCQKRHRYENARWLQGSADCLPISDTSVDIVINVESSHCYPSMEKFLQEVKRVLRPGGYLAFCDLRQADSIGALDQNMLNREFTIVNRDDITSQVIIALDDFSCQRKAQIAAVFPPIVHKMVNEFAAIKNTKVYNMLLKRELIYLSYLLQKPVS
jgi:ubiquinone/menaquinone biosynthesis C-methylase UbiE